MKLVNCLSGGKTSSYIAANYKSDHNVFALVRTNDIKCIFPDKKIRQIVSDKLGLEFIGTLEDDMIIYTMLDLEQGFDTGFLTHRDKLTHPGLLPELIEMARQPGNTIPK